MDAGKIIAEGSPRQLIDRYSTREVLELRMPDDVRAGLDGALSALADRVQALPDRLQLYTSDAEHVLERVRAMGLPLDSALVRRTTLEDVFLQLTGHTLVE
jgi:lipooligosaccharide transport system ATP-binding protein